MSINWRLHLRVKALGTTYGVESEFWTQVLNSISQNALYSEKNMP